MDDILASASTSACASGSATASGHSDDISDTNNRISPVEQLSAFLIVKLTFMNTIPFTEVKNATKIAFFLLENERPLRLYVFFRKNVAVIAARQLKRPTIRTRKVFWQNH